MKKSNSDIQYVVSIKEDTAYLCLHFTKDHEGNKINTPYPENPIRRIQAMEIKYSGRYRTWSLLQETPNTPYRRLLIRLAAKNHFMELNELMELRDGAYENTRIYQERTKKRHDSRLRGDKDFKVGDKVLLFNSRFKMHPGKLKSKWYGPNVVKTVYPYGTIQITDKNKITFKVNGQRLKKYYDGHIDTEDNEDVEFKEDTT
ncbi:hypothetical protein Tco_0290423 [Tanacetum coccineum]